MLEGVTAGFILSLTLYPGTVWLAKVGRVGTKKQVLTVGLALGLSQLVWLLFSIPGLMMMMAHLSFLSTQIYWFAAFVLGYMSLKFLRARRVSSLMDVHPEELEDIRELFWSAFNRAFAMPMRLPIAMAVLLATSVFINKPATWETVPYVSLGAFIGVLWWWGQFTFLAAFFAKRVPERITIRSLNKIRPFCTALFSVLAVIVLLLSAKG